MTVLGLAGVVALIAANGFFVAAEFAFVAARSSRFVEHAAAGDRRARRALDVQGRLRLMLSGAQLGIAVTTIVLGFVAEPVIAAVLDPALVAVGIPESASLGVALAVALALATVVQMVFGELAPKNLAVAGPERVARRLAPVTWWALRLFEPAVRLFDGAANTLLRLARIDPVERIPGAIDTEELDRIVDSSHESGHLTTSQAGLLERAIDFGELQASDAMVPWNRVVTVGTSASAADLRDLMSSTHSRFPVVDDDEVRGIVHAKDLLGVSREAYAATPVTAMLRDVLAVPEAAGLSVVLAELRAHATEMAIVIDEYGGPAGVVTLEDIVEELVGDIEDEYDPSAPGEHVETEPGVWSVTAASRPDEIERVTGLDLPDGEYDTIAGLVLEHLEYIPEVGETFVVHGVEFEVLEVDGFAIQRLQLRVDPEALPSDPLASDAGGVVATDPPAADVVETASANGSSRRDDPEVGAEGSDVRRRR